MMDKDFIHMFLYAVLFKLADELTDEDIYNIWFPKGKVIIYTLLILYTIYLFYFKSKDSPIYLFLYVVQSWYTIILSSKYFKMDFLVLLGEMKLTLDDPFTQLSLIQMPGFIYNFNYIFKTHFVTLSWVIIGAGLAGIFQDIDNSILGTYILKNRFSKPESKKINKIIYRSGFILILLVLFFLFKKNPFKLSALFMMSYFATSVISLVIQINHEDSVKSKILDEQIEKLQIRINNIVDK